MPAPELPDEWRATMVAWVRGAEEPDASWFAGGPHLDPRQQIEVYREQFRLRLGDAVLEEVPGWSHLVGDDEAERRVHAYLAAHPPSDWTLNRVADAFVGWLEDTGARPQEIDLAALDHAVMAGFEAAPGTSLTPEQLGAMPPLRLQPHVRLLRPGFDVHVYRSTVLGDGEPPELTAGDYPLVVYRRQRRMRHRVLDDGAWRVLDALRRGHTVADALEDLVASGMAPEDLGPQLQSWFRAFAELDLVEAA